MIFDGISQSVRVDTVGRLQVARQIDATEVLIYINIEYNISYKFQQLHSNSRVKTRIHTLRQRLSNRVESSRLNIIRIQHKRRQRQHVSKMAWIKRGRGDKAMQQMTFTIVSFLNQDTVLSLLLLLSLRS